MSGWKVVSAMAVARRCDALFALIHHTAVTMGNNDATVVTFFALDRMTGSPRLLVLDWDIAQIEGRRARALGYRAYS